MGTICIKQTLDLGRSCVNNLINCLVASMSKLTDAPETGEPPSPAKPKRRVAKKSDLSSRELLLRAASKEFATKGLEGARVDQIAKKAGVNKQLVYHHFSSKEALYQAVVEQAYARIRAEEAKLHLDAGDAKEAMTRLVVFSFDYLAANRDFVSLLTDVNFHQGRHFKASENLPQLHTLLVGMIKETLDRGAAAGQFRADADPVQLYISIAGLGFFYFNNIHTLSSIFDRKFNDKTHIAERRAHVVDFVLQALRPD
ncbi:TetR/AcrR family transcriptional regulator [Devosia sp. 1635]|uniref:TetR/AcrR family transcriptional regulator n=2 Tax=unclassified Devosia TaxID=196773 RepID=UPI0032BF9F77